MSAGTPNYSRLAQLGRLPQNMRDKIPGLVAADKAEKKLEEVKEQMCADCKDKIFGEKTVVVKDEVTQGSGFKCPVEGCDFEGRNANGLRLHSKKHGNKINENEQ